MRTLLAMILACGVTIGSASAAPVLMSMSPGGIALVEVADQQPEEVPANVELKGATAWYRSPVWVAVGVLGFIAIIALVVGATRSKTTAVED